FLAIRLLARKLRSKAPARTVKMKDLLPPAKAVWVALPATGIAVLFVARDAVAASIAVVVIAAASWVIWFALYSGRVRTATHDFRARLTHVAFMLFFVSYALGIALWLVVGLLAGITGHSAGLHERMHRFGGAPNVLIVAADDVAP